MLLRDLYFVKELDDETRAKLIEYFSENEINKDFLKKSIESLNLTSIAAFKDSFFSLAPTDALALSIASFLMFVDLNFLRSFQALEIATPVTDSEWIAALPVPILSLSKCPLLFLIAQNGLQNSKSWTLRFLAIYSSCHDSSVAAFQLESSIYEQTIDDINSIEAAAELANLALINDDDFSLEIILEKASNLMGRSVSLTGFEGEYQRNRPAAILSISVNPQEKISEEKFNEIEQLRLAEYTKLGLPAPACLCDSTYYDCPLLYSKFDEIPQEKSVQILVLISAYLHQQRNPDDRIVDTEMRAYYQYLINQSVDYSITLSCLLLRALCDLRNPKFTNRAIEQLYLSTKSDQVASCGFIERIENFFCSPLIRYPVFRIAALAANYLFSAGRVADAAECFAKTENWASFAGCLLLIGKVDEARKVCEDHFDESNVDILVTLGEINNDAELLEKAWIQSKQRCARAKRDLGKLYRSTDSTKAAQCYRESLQVEYSPEAAFALATLIMDSQPKEALDLFKSVTASRPDAADAWANAATCSVRLGEFSAGKSFVQEALKIENYNPKMWSLFIYLGIKCEDSVDSILHKALEQLRAHSDAVYADFCFGIVNMLPAIAVSCEDKNTLRSDIRAVIEVTGINEAVNAAFDLVKE